MSDTLQGLDHFTMIDVSHLIYNQADRTEKSCKELEHALDVMSGLNRDNPSEDDSDLTEVVKELYALVIQLRQGGALVDEFIVNSRSLSNKSSLRLESLS